MSTHAHQAAIQEVRDYVPPPLPPTLKEKMIDSGYIVLFIICSPVIVPYFMAQELWWKVTK